MSFNYDRIVAKEGETASWWTSYADLFLMLSIVFLLMYVASALRNGSAGFQQQQQFKQLSEKAQGLEQQIRVYNTLKDQALREQSTQAEQEVYQKLMDKLNLLQDEARNEKVALRKKAQDNEDKEFALNQYQQLVQNIVNANILAKKQIRTRDVLIVKKDATIEEKRQQIADMEHVVAQNEEQIHSIQSQLADRIAALREEQRQSKASKADTDMKIAALRMDSEVRVQALEDKKRAINQELTQVRGTLQATTARLDEAKDTIQAKNQTIRKVEQEKGTLAAQLSDERDRYVQELGDLRATHAKRLADERAVFMKNLEKQRMSADARAKQIARFAAGAERKAQELEGQLSGLGDKIRETDEKLRGAQAQLAGTQSELAGTRKALGDAEGQKNRALAAVEDLQDDLARTRAIANARKTLAQQIASQFSKAGVKGVVDGKTGEVTLDFGGEYFDTGSTSLKPKMRVTLDKFIPLYARSLFNNPKLAEKIANIEIVGFASSTYHGKYVNPQSLRAEDKQAIEYNLNLSFGRANSIFKHVLDSNNLTRDEHQRLMPLMKVVGRGYLPDGKNASDLPDSMTEKEFCEKYNCRAAQKVVVKFNMKD